MITVFRALGLRVAIYGHDHGPPHVHVIGDGEAKIALLGRRGLPELIEVRRMSGGELRKALRVVAENQGMLLDLWREIHG